MRKNNGKKGKTVTAGDITATVEYRTVKNINLYIKPPLGEVFITAPICVPESAILAFLEQKQEWIVRHQKKMKARAGNADIPAEPNEEAVERMQEKIREYVKKWEPLMGVHATRWTIREMKTRWGSCTPDTGRIRLNRRLAAYPNECLEYVMVHELCHLLEPSHNQRFHGLMSGFLPDWKERKKKLNQTAETEGAL